MRTGKVLIIDDDPEICDVLQYAIEAEGYTARVAENGDIGLEIIADWVPNLVLLDYYGVDEIVGHFTQALREIDDSIPVVLMTGAREPARKARELGLKEYLAKPFDVQALRTILRRHAGRRGAVNKRAMAFSLFE